LRKLYVKHLDVVCDRERERESMCEQAYLKIKLGLVTRN
jgi:hypothetical protein